MDVGLAADLAARLHAAVSRAAAAAAPGGAAAGAAKAKAAEWLGHWSRDPESREALVALGGNSLLEFLLSVSCEDPSPEQAAAESVLCDLLASHHCAARLLQRPGAAPALLAHVGSGKASERLAGALGGAAGGFADHGVGGGAAALSGDDARALVKLLGSRNGQQVWGCTRPRSHTFEVPFCCSAPRPPEGRIGAQRQRRSAGRRGGWEVRPK
jgi:hypothetical protein